MTSRATRVRWASLFLGAAALVLLGVCPLPAGWLRTARDSMRSQGLNRADQEAGAGGYYEGLIGGGVGPEGGQSEADLRLAGKPAHWIRFDQAGVARVLPRDFFQFELLPDLNRPLFGQPFTTNAFALRDRPYARAKPPGVFRIVLLGSSMDMGWGVSTPDTYENRLEDWLNAYARKHGLARRFEVVNFAVAAYGPVQRLELFRRKAAAFDPDLVIYSTTMLDLRLLEIHLCSLLQGRIDLRHDFLRQAVARAGVTDRDLELNTKGLLIRKEELKAKLRPEYWTIIDATLESLAADCRSAGVPLLELIIPRVGKADAPAARAESVSHHRAIAARHGVPLIDLAGTFDGRDPADLEIAAWDDHPNALGHKLLFLALARSVTEDPAIRSLILGPAPQPAGLRRVKPAVDHTMQPH